MRIALIADTFPPLRTSGAVQLRDLSSEFARQGHQVTVMLPDGHQKTSWALEQIYGVRVIRLRSPNIKNVNYLRRVISEFFMPYFMRRNFLKSPLANEAWDSIVWYSPSIFHGPFVKFLKLRNNCKSYLVIRDIFPEWAVDMGLMSRGLPYRFFNLIARYQYSLADIIGVQAAGNMHYFIDWLKAPNRKLEVLQNWLGEPAKSPSPIQISQTFLAGRKIFVYAGNMGVAQNVGIFLEVAKKLHGNSNVGFLFVGRGSDLKRLKSYARINELKNTLFLKEINPDEIPALFSQCHVGIVALDSRHKSHNIPGKFICYMQSGLPVLANVNPGNDLAEMIRSERVGTVCESNNIFELSAMAENILTEIADGSTKDRCRSLFQARFSVEQAVNQIVAALC